VKISIADTGIGIPEEDLPKIFDPYFSVRERTGEEKAGLGLTLCYAVIKNHRGDIVVESKIGEGTTFHIYLPVCQQEETTKNKAAQGYRVPSAA
jgi:signal transduction histidine kinase